MIPSAFDQLDSWRRERRRLGHLLLALDFDGTLAPIVSRPENAQMLEDARGGIERLLKRGDTDVAFISGRSLADLRDRCAFEDVYYSGNHGLEMDGPGVRETREQAVELRPRVRAIAKVLKQKLDGINGVLLEDKHLTLSVHSRMIDDERERERVLEIVKDAVRAEGDGLKLTYGKRVIEVRPDVQWHKGEATLYLIEAVEKARGSAVYPIFIGDDVTDEDAFAALQGRGAGVLVASDLPDRTAANAWVRSPHEVALLLEALAE